MNKIKNIFAFTLLVVLIYSCGSSSSSEIDDFDHEAQALIDNDSLVKFLKYHYFDTSIDSIKPIVAGETSLLDDTSKLKTMKVDFDDIEYKMYVYVNSEGNPVPSKAKPTILDSILVNYHLGYFSDTINYTPIQKLNTATWFDPRSIAVEGWLQGFTNFKGGKNVTANGPITYEEGGNGILFIPSGLAYRNIGSLSVPSNANLIYYINLFDIVENTDHDNDGVASIFENPDEDGDKDPRNEDTDGDFIPNYLDTDDDGDGVLTKDEDTKIPDGNPANDFSDPNNPDLPDYLNPDIK